MKPTTTAPLQKETTTHELNMSPAIMRDVMFIAGKFLPSAFADEPIRSVERKGNVIMRIAFPGCAFRRVRVNDMYGWQNEDTLRVFTA